MPIRGLETLDLEAGTIDEDEAHTVLTKFEVELTPEARRVFGEFQYAQDRGMPYAKALATALHHWPSEARRAGVAW